MTALDASPQPPADDTAVTASTPKGRSGSRARIGVVVLSHPILDAYAGYVPPILGLLQVRCDLSPAQAAALLATGPLVSGLSQPLCAALADRLDSRMLGSAGLVLAAAAMSAIGLVSSFAGLLILFAVGLAGVGAYHPVAAAAAGELAGSRRSAVVTMFFVAGMIGATAGPYISSRLTAIDSIGFTLLGWTMVPGLVFAAVLHLAIRDVPHKAARPRVPIEPADVRRRWSGVIVLFAGNAMRYFVNIAMLYTFVRWAEHVVARDGIASGREGVAAAGALYAGELSALMMFGMGAGGLVAGLRVRLDAERRAFVLVPLLLAPALVLFPVTGRVPGYLLAVATGIGYGALIPVSIAMAQRLLPHRTSLASSLVMGGAWCTAATAPPIMHVLHERFGLASCFAVTAVVLAASGIVGLALPRRRDAPLHSAP